MSVFRAFATVSGMTLISRALGLVREIMIAALLGASAVAEAFVVAFRFPNLFRRFFAEGAFNMAFVPMFAKRLEDGRDPARAFGEEVLAGLLSVLFVFVLIAQLAMPWFIYGIAAGFADDPEKLDLAVLFARIQFPYLLFMSLTAFFSGVLNSLGKFAAAAGAPILLNLAMIGGMAGAWALEQPVGHWLSWSVLIAGILQLGLVARAAARAGLRFRLKRPRWTPDLKRLVVLGVPGALAGGVTQINILIGTVVASFFDGAVVWLTLADRLYQLPLGVVGVAIGVALLPELSRRAQAADADGAAWSLNRAVELAMLLTLPAAAALMTTPEALVRLLYGRGAFTEADVAATGMALFLFAAGLPAYVLIKALSPAYFAREDTRTPLRFAAVSMAVNSGLAVALIPAGGAVAAALGAGPSAGGYGWIAVPIATAVAAWVNAALLWRGLVRIGAHRPDARLGARLARAAAASLAMAVCLLVAAWAMGSAIADPVGKYPSVLGLVALGLAAYAIAALAFGAARMSELKSMMRRRPGSEEVHGGA